MPKQKLYKPNFFFNALKYFEDFIFEAIKKRTKAEQMNYLIYLKDRCQKELDTVSMKNKRSEIFKLLDAIDNNDNKETGEIDKK